VISGIGERPASPSDFEDINGRKLSPSHRRTNLT
jgi:hypothetical protein